MVMYDKRKHTHKHKQPESSTTPMALNSIAMLRGCDAFGNHSRCRREIERELDGNNCYWRNRRDSSFGRKVILDRLVLKGSSIGDLGIEIIEQWTVLWVFSGIKPGHNVVILD